MDKVKLSTLLFVFITTGTPIMAQTGTNNADRHAALEEELRQRRGNYQQEFDSIKNVWKREYYAFRAKTYEQYLDFVKKAWGEFKGEPAMELPKEKTVVPVLSDNATEQTASWFNKLFKKKDDKTSKRKSKKGESISYGQLLPPEPVHQQPEPIFSVAEEKVQENPYMEFSLFGTLCRVRIGDNCKVMLSSLKSETIADVMKQFTQPQFKNLLYDCLQERKRHNFSDWAYYQMLQALVDKFYGKETSEGSLVLAFLYSQSGYKQRMVHDGKKLYMLAASRHWIYGKDYIWLDKDRFYLLDGRKLSQAMYVCPAAFEKEGSMSLQMSAVGQFDVTLSPERTITSTQNREFSFTISSNKNYVDFYDTYPCSTIGENYMTQWVMYAETPIEQSVRNQLYPQIREKIMGMSELEAVQQLLWWVQTGFKYEYDEVKWGGERNFFAEETLYYDVCDCEDRAVLLSHLVRDLVGLDVALVHYPGHLASAVAFTKEVDGDYYLCNGRKFTVCDPTYIGSNVGETMTSVIGEKATLMLLKRN